MLFNMFKIFLGMERDKYYYLTKCALISPHLSHKQIVKTTNKQNHTATFRCFHLFQFKANETRNTYFENIKGVIFIFLSPAGPYLTIQGSSNLHIT